LKDHRALRLHRMRFISFTRSAVRGFSFSYHDARSVVGQVLTATKAHVNSFLIALRRSISSASRRKPGGNWINCLRGWSGGRRGGYGPSRYQPLPQNINDCLFVHPYRLRYHREIISSRAKKVASAGPQAKERDGRRGWGGGGMKVR